MKKIILFLCLIFLFPLSTQLISGHLKKYHSCFSGALSSGYVFKHDKRFKDVYGHGIVNVLTADGCYYPWDCWGVGTKISYWRTKGRTAFLKLRSLAQEVPVTLYLRGVKKFTCRLQGYASLGGGFVWVKEKSYLGRVSFYKAIGEIELGLNYLVWRCIYITAACRYLFPSQSHAHQTTNVGGVDLRAGIGFSF